MLAHLRLRTNPRLVVTSWDTLGEEDRESLRYLRGDPDFFGIAAVEFIFHDNEAVHEGQKVGVDLARDLLAQCRTRANGVYLMPSFGRYENCLEVLEGVLSA